MTDACSETGIDPVFPAHADRVYGALDKERFDLCMTMLKSYYEGLEARVAGTITALLVATGWLIGSDAARNALQADPWLCGVAIVTLTTALLMYGANVEHWVRRWREIRGHATSLHYMEERFFARYELPPWTGFAYFLPPLLLYVFFLVCLGLTVLPSSTGCSAILSGR